MLPAVSESAKRSRVWGEVSAADGSPASRNRVQSRWQSAPQCHSNQHLPSTHANVYSCGNGDTSALFASDAAPMSNAPTSNTCGAHSYRHPHPHHPSFLDSLPAMAFSNHFQRSGELPHPTPPIASMTEPSPRSHAYPQSQSRPSSLHDNEPLPENRARDVTVISQIDSRNVQYTNHGGGQPFSVPAARHAPNVAHQRAHTTTNNNNNVGVGSDEACGDNSMLQRSQPVQKTGIHSNHHVPHGEQRVIMLQRGFAEFQHEHHRLDQHQQCDRPRDRQDGAMPTNQTMRMTVLPSAATNHHGQASRARHEVHPFMLQTTTKASALPLCQGDDPGSRSNPAPAPAPAAVPIPMTPPTPTPTPMPSEVTNQTPTQAKSSRSWTWMMEQPQPMLLTLTSSPFRVCMANPAAMNLLGKSLVGCSVLDILFGTSSRKEESAERAVLIHNGKLVSREDPARLASAATSTSTSMQAATPATSSSSASPAHVSVVENAPSILLSGGPPFSTFITSLTLPDLLGELHQRRLIRCGQDTSAADGGVWMDVYPLEAPTTSQNRGTGNDSGRSGQATRKCGTDGPVSGGALARSSAASVSALSLVGRSTPIRCRARVRLLYDSVPQSNKMELIHNVLILDPDVSIAQSLGAWG